MKYLTVFVLFILITSCFNAERVPSKSYKEIESYLREAKIDDKSIIYFFSEKPRMPIPNVYCFDSNGVELNAPSQCFQYIEEYIGFLNDSVMPAKINGQSLTGFLNAIPLVDIYENPVKYDGREKYSYYLFIDWLAIPDQNMKETLFKSQNAVKKSSKNIRLFLVHTISSLNADKLSDSKIKTN